MLAVLQEEQARLLAVRPAGTNVDGPAIGLPIADPAPSVTRRALFEAQAAVAQAALVDVVDVAHNSITAGGSGEDVRVPQAEIRASAVALAELAAAFEELHTTAAVWLRASRSLSRGGISLSTPTLQSSFPKKPDLGGLDASAVPPAARAALAASAADIVAKTAALLVRHPALRPLAVELAERVAVCVAAGGAWSEDWRGDPSHPEDHVRISRAAVTEKFPDAELCGEAGEADDDHWTAALIELARSATFKMRAAPLPLGAPPTAAELNGWLSVAVAVVFAGPLPVPGVLVSGEEASVPPVAPCAGAAASDAIVEAVKRRARRHAELCDAAERAIFVRRGAGPALPVSAETGGGGVEADRRRVGGLASMPSYSSHGGPHCSLVDDPLARSAAASVAATGPLDVALAGVQSVPLHPDTPAVGMVVLRPNIAAAVRSAVPRAPLPSSDFDPVAPCAGQPTRIGVSAAAGDKTDAGSPIVSEPSLATPPLSSPPQPVTVPAYAILEVLCSEEGLALTAVQRTVNFKFVPADFSDADVAVLAAAFGVPLRVRVGSRERPRKAKPEPAKGSGFLHCFVEYDTVESAERAKSLASGLPLAGFRLQCSASRSAIQGRSPADCRIVSGVLQRRCSFGAVSSLSADDAEAAPVFPVTDAAAESLTAVLEPEQLAACRAQGARFPADERHDSATLSLRSYGLPESPVPAAGGRQSTNKLDSAADMPAVETAETLLASLPGHPGLCPSARPVLAGGAPDLRSPLLLLFAGASAVPVFAPSPFAAVSVGPGPLAVAGGEADHTAV